MSVGAPQTAVLTRHDMDLRKMPAVVKLGLRLYLASLVVGLLKISIPGWGTPSISDMEGPDLVFNLFVWASTLSVILWLLLMVQRRRNWARIALGTLFGFGLLTSRWTVAPQYTAGLVSALSASIQIVLQAIGIILLFLPSSSRWFRGLPGKPGNAP
jgi:hypothetical protein